MAGRNRALLTEQHALAAKAGNAGSCIYISHFQIDRNVVHAIANYIMEHGGLDVYFDETDADIEMDALLKEPARVTKCIERGILLSTHILSLVSKETCKSWWIPYAIGFAKSSNKGVAILKLKGSVELPEYLKIATVLRSTKSLNVYLEAVRGTGTKKDAISESLLEHKVMNHPLDNILDWQELA
ncbi:MAG: hypothetical protein WBR29_09570 [Gammaproteobacteria bacterium]